jgi:hypothetical protein
MDKALADAIRAIDSNTGQGSMAAKERKRKKPPRLNDGKPKGGRESKPPKRKADETQIQVSINVRPDDWTRFKAKAAKEGVSAAAKLGNAIIEPKIEPATLCMSAQQRLEAAIRQHKRQLDSEFEQRIQNECKRRLDALSLPAYAKEMAEYVEMVKSRKGHLTREVYRSILACLNSATRLGVTDKRLDEAFVAFKKLELVLCNEKEASTPNYTFPRTFAEMMARKQAVSEARKTKRASRGIPERR